MLIENYYMQRHQEDEEGEYEWIDFPTIDGIKRVKRYFDKIEI